MSKDEKVVGVILISTVQVVEARRHIADHNKRIAAGEAPGAAPIAPISNIVFMVCLSQTSLHLHKLFAVFFAYLLHN